MNVSALVFASLMLALLLSLALALLLRRMPDSDGARLCALAFAPLAVGQALRWVEVDTTLQVVLHDPLVLTGFALLLSGLRQSLHLRRPWRLPAALVLGSLVSNALFTAIWPLPSGRDAVRLFGIAALSGACGLSLRALREPALQPVRHFLQAAFGLQTALSLLRLALLAGTASETTVLLEDLARLSQWMLLLAVLLGLLLLLAARLNLTLERMSIEDALTGLLNPRGLEEATHTMLALARRLGRPVGLLLCELQVPGPDEGGRGGVPEDEALRAFAALLQQHFEGGELAGRLGGRRFAVLLPGAGPEEAMRAAQALRERGEAGVLRQEGGCPWSLTMHIAALSVPALSAAWPAMLARADAALGEAKTCGDGRGCVLVRADDPPPLERRPQGSGEVASP